MRTIPTDVTIRSVRAVVNTTEEVDTVPVPDVSAARFARVVQENFSKNENMYGTVWSYVLPRVSNDVCEELWMYGTAGRYVLLKFIGYM